MSKKRVFQICVLLSVLIAGWLLVSCSSIPKKASPDESLVLVKTEIVNPDGVHTGVDIFVHYYGEDATSHFGDNAGKYIMKVIKNSSAMIESITSAPRGNFTGHERSFNFNVPLPYEPGKVVVADTVITETLRRAATPTLPDGFTWRVSTRQITKEEKDALMKEVSADGSFASWLP